MFDWLTKPLDWLFGIKRCPHCGGGCGFTLPERCSWCYKLIRKED